MAPHYDPSDPFTLLFAPPPNETPEERAMREEREAEAQKISDLIDEGIKVDRAERKKVKNVVKVLLLGQSESGKSTTLKNFRMKYSRDEWLAERASWRVVIQLNIVRSINAILHVLYGDPAESEEGLPPLQVTDEHLLLKIRLGPLRAVEEDLKRLLGASSEEIIETSLSTQQATPFGGPPVRNKPSGEFGVRSWRNIMQIPYHGKDKQHQGTGVTGPDVNDVNEVIASCKGDMKTLWEDKVVQEMLARGRTRLEDSANFFFNALDRLTARTYEPTDDDILRARLQTKGVQEYTLHGESAGERIWRLFDVGGSRTMRAAWQPYFDDVNAIIFLAPISCFDEKLAEDLRINRLEDSFMLWKAICSSKLLAKSTMVLFLNKCDILEEKLGRGIQFNKYLKSYGNRPNEHSAVIKYLRQKFKESMIQHSPESRVFYAYATVVTETKATAMTLKSVRDGILREHLKHADLV